jgi:hypothetical protein
MAGRARPLLLGALLFGCAATNHAADGFGLFKTVVGIDRISPPQVILPIKQ